MGETWTENEKAVHPGKHLAKVLEDRNMSQQELSVRTGMTEKHISTVVNCRKGISAEFAKKLEYALGVSALEWMGLQAEYDQAMLKFEEQNDITSSEHEALKRLKDILPYFKEYKDIADDSSEADCILAARKAMGVVNLDVIPSIRVSAAYRAQIRKDGTVDPYVLYAWLRLCEAETEPIEIDKNADVEGLKSALPRIKKLMFEDINVVEERLTAILANYGIAFGIVHHFTGAPVQGFIRRPEGQEKIILCLTLRGKRADRFWFTLFHEIGHIVNGDVSAKYIDFHSAKNEMEEKADLFAQKTLIDPAQYLSFLRRHDYSLSAIRRFAKSQDVEPYIVIGRMQAEEILKWSDYSEEIIYYEWVA